MNFFSVSFSILVTVADDRPLIVRIVLGLYNACCMISFSHGVQRSFGRVAGGWYIIFQASQFHMMYYASRTLPNFFALGLSEFILVTSKTSTTRLMFTSYPCYAKFIT